MTASTELLRTLPALAREAGDAILKSYESATIEMLKTDRSPLTVADRVSHEILVRGLRTLSSVPVISEEGELPGTSVRSAWSAFWLIDPLDGTKEFLKRSGEFTVNIALIEKNRPVVGVVFAPALDVMYGASEGAGAWVERDGTRVPIQCKVASSPLRVAVSRDHSGPDEETLLARLGSVQRVPRGSSLKFCSVAEGEIDLYPRLGPTMEWDTAAAQCVVEEAGGVVITASSEPLRYNKVDLRNPPLYTLADAGLRSQLGLQPA